MSDAFYVDTDTGETAIRRLNVGANKQYASYISYASNVLPPSADGLINGVSITALNKRTRTSGASAVDCVRTWTTRASPADIVWLSVCWAPELSLFAAVAFSGTGNRVMTSPDGITWTARASAADNEWRFVCWAPELSLFVAVATSGTGNRVMTSPNGITWTARTSANDNGWISVCWAPELSLFVAVGTGPGSGNRVMTSPDGIAWTERTSAADNIWREVCWAPELSLFVAVASSGAGNRVMTSPDGIAWTARTSAADNGWDSVCWAPELSLFVAVGSGPGTGNRVMTSPDGINWTLRTSATDSGWSEVCWAPEISLFVAVANSGTVMTSPDGITWTARTPAAVNEWYSVCWAAELSLFAAVGGSGTGNRVMTSAIGMPNSKSVVKALPSQMMVSATGNVGIGTTNPLAKLHVNGSIYNPGGIVQTQTFFNYFTTAQNVGTSDTSTNILVTITPKFSNSKLLIIFNTGMTAYNNSQTLYTFLYRNGSNLTNGVYGWSFNQDSISASTIYGPITNMYVDTPGAIASYTYTVWGKSSLGTASVVHINSYASLIVHEIAQ